MGCKVFAIGDAREALELLCDCPSHEGEGRAWFDCGTYEGNLTLGLAAGWRKRRNDGWACPRCTRKSEGKPRSRVKTTNKIGRGFWRLAIAHQFSVERIARLLDRADQNDRSGMVLETAP